MGFRKDLAKAGIVLAAAGVIFTAGVTPVSAKVVSDVGVAGITRQLDKFYTNKKTVKKTSVKASKKETVTAKEVSEFENVGISIASNYVNIRKEPNTDSEIVGKLYKGCAATILERKGEWVKIKSGNAKGYINADFLAIGFDAEELVDKYGTRWATVNVDGLRIRMEPSLEAKIATVVAHGEKLLVVRVVDKDWYEISMDDGDITGYVYSEYVDIDVQFEHAITIEEEQAEIQRQKEAEEALKRQQEQQAAREAAAKKAREEAAKKAKEDAKKAKDKNSSKDKDKDTKDDNFDGEVVEYEYVPDMADEIVAFAKKFVGNRYVYGGTSLTNGCDCSGFVQQVYKNFGITIARDSRSQCRTSGYEVSINDVVPGDLIFYTNNSGVVSHVAMYIGNGKIVHAADPRSGICIGNMRYRSPYKAKRILN